MRLFVGIELDDGVRDGAARVSDALRRTVLDTVNARWIAASNLHITLWFLGEVDEPRREELLRILGRPYDEPPFDLEIAGLGAFPPSGAPRVFWLGVRSGGESLRRLHSELTVRLVPFGFEAERRPYSAHLTIARVKDVSRAVGHHTLRERLQAIPAAAGSCRTTHLTVFRSRLSPRGANYEPLLRVPLK